MKTYSLFRLSGLLGLSVLGLTALCASTAVHAADDSNLRLILSVDMTPAGKKLTPATPEKPVYFFPVVYGYHELGGLGDTVQFYQKKPEDMEVVQPLVAALAKQGYLPANKEFPPSIVLTFLWGSIAPQIAKNPDPKDPGVVITNLQEMHGYLIGEKIMNAVLTQQNKNSQDMLVQSSEASHFLVITAMDLADFKQHKETILWRAHVSSSAYGYYLKNVITQYITAVAPRLGRETDPGLIPTQTAPDGHVTIGEALVVSGPPPVEKKK